MPNTSPIPHELKNPTSTHHGDSSDGNTKRAASGDCEQSVLDHVQAGHGQLSTTTVRAFQDCELRAV